jgi:hypothetical protein
MSDKIAHLLDRLRELEKDIDREVDEQRHAAEAALKAGAARFSDEVRARHRKLRTGLVAYMRGATLPVMLTAPITYILVVPFLLLDLLATFISTYASESTASVGCDAPTTSPSTATASATSTASRSSIAFTVATATES